MCRMATGASFACGTMNVASLTPSIPYQAIWSISGFGSKARHTRGTPSLTAIRSILHTEEKDLAWVGFSR